MSMKPRPEITKVRNKPDTVPVRSAQKSIVVVEINAVNAVHWLWRIGCEDKGFPGCYGAS